MTAQAARCAWIHSAVTVQKRDERMPEPMDREISRQTEVGLNGSEPLLVRSLQDMVSHAALHDRRAPRPDKFFFFVPTLLLYHPIIKHGNKRWRAGN